MLSTASGSTAIWLHCFGWRKKSVPSYLGKEPYTQVRETFAQCAIDYDKDDAAARTFFATSQDARFVSRLRSRRGGSVGQPSGCDWRATCLSRTVTDLA